jgi:hypothetical protein
MSATGESDLMTYYDGIAAPQPDEMGSGDGGRRKCGKDDDLEWRTTEDGHHFAFSRRDGVIRARFARKLNGQKLDEARSMP